MKRFLLALLLLPSAAMAATPPAQTVSLSSAEKSYYALAFTYAMETMEDGKPYAWGTYNGKGNIVPAETFISKSGSTCRSYSENYTIQGVQGSTQGYGCKRRGEDGWCRLRLKQALTCAMERRGILDGIDVPNIDLNNMPNINLKTPNINIDGSAISMPSLPSMPNTNIDPNVDVGATHAPTGSDIADSVTSAAGSVAGPVASGTMQWFQQTFR